MERGLRLRLALVAHLERAGILRSHAVAGAMRAVPRHRFLPGLSLEEAYADQAIALKMHGDDVLSSISQPSMVAQMLELLAPQPGERILEIGTGSGYNAALLAEMAGPAGAVTSVELDDDMGRRASRALRETGYGRVTVLTADGATEFEPARAYDRVIVTARCDDVAEQWWQATREGGRIVVPLRLGAGEFAVGFERRGERLDGIGVHPCAFIALRGEAAEAGPEHFFFRDATQAPAAPFSRAIASIEAVRARHATPELLEAADVVVARPVTMFGIRFR